MEAEKSKPTLMLISADDEESNLAIFLDLYRSFNVNSAFEFH